jgi:hypothetical protein
VGEEASEEDVAGMVMAGVGFMAAMAVSMERGLDCMGSAIPITVTAVFTISAGWVTPASAATAVADPDSIRLHP